MASLIFRIEEALKQRASLEQEEKKAKKEIELMAEKIEKLDEKIFTLMFNSLSICTNVSINLLKKYFPKIGGERYALAIERRIRYYASVADDPKKEGVKMSGAEKKAFKEKWEKQRIKILTSLQVLLSDSNARFVAFALICLKAFFVTDMDDETYRKARLLYSLPSFRSIVIYLCEDTPRLASLYVVNETVAQENQEILSYAETMIKEHRIDEKNTSVRDYILSQDTDHRVKLPLDYFNNVIFDDRLNRFDFAMQEGLSELLVGDEMDRAEEEAMQNAIRAYMEDPTEKNLVELNVLSNQFIGKLSVQKFMADEMLKYFKGKEDYIDSIDAEKAILFLYLNSFSVVCTKVAVSFIGMILTYRPYLMPIYEEFERLAACEELVNTALDSCKDVINLKTSRLQELYKEFSQFGKILIIRYLPKDSMTKRGVIKYNAFKNTEHPQWMARELLATKELQLKEMLLGEVPCGFDSWFIGEFVQNLVTVNVSVLLSEKDFFRLMEGYLNLFPPKASMYRHEVLRQIGWIVRFVQRQEIKKIEKIWNGYSDKKAKVLLAKIDALLRAN